MAERLINQLSSGSINDAGLILTGDSQTGILSQTSYKAAKDYFQQGLQASFNTGSLATTASLNSFTASYNQDSASFNSQIGNVIVAEGKYLLTSSFAAYSASVVLDSGSFNSRIVSLSGSLQSLTGSYITTGSFNTFTSSINSQFSNVFASQSNYILTSSFNSLSSSYHTDSSSLYTEILNVYASESNYTLTSSFTAFSSSVNSKLTGSVSSAGSTYPAESTIGAISNLSSWSNYSQWQPVASNTIALDPSTGFMDIASTDESFTSYVKYQPSQPSCLNHWKRQTTFKIKAWDPSSAFFGFGVKSINSNDNADFIGYIGTANDGVGNITLNNQGGGNVNLGTATGFTNHLNDVIQLTMTFDNGLMTFGAKNLTTTSSSGLINYTFTTGSGVPTMPNTHVTAFWYFSLATGVIEIQNVNISSTEVKNPNNLFIVDSKYSYFPDSFSTRWFETLNNSFPSTIVNGGQGDTVNLALARKFEILNANAENVFLEACSNDLRFGRTLTQLENDILTLKSWFDGTSTKFNFFIIPENTASGSSGNGSVMLPLHNWATGSLSGSYIPNVWVSMSISNSLNPLYNHGDDIHINQAGNTIVASILSNSGRIGTIDPNRKTPFLNGDSSIALTGNKIGSFWNTERATNYINKWDSNSNSVASNITDNGSAVIVSRNQSALPSLVSPGIVLGVNGYISTFGGTSGIIFQDEVNNGNDHFLTSISNLLGFGYNGGFYQYNNGPSGDINIGAKSTTWIGNGLYISKDTTINNDILGAKGGFLFTVDKSTLTVTGVGPIIETAPVKINRSIINVPGGGIEFINASSLYIEGPPIPTGSVMMDNLWSLRVATGSNFFGGNVNVGTSTVSSSALNIAASTTTLAQINLATGSAPTSPKYGDIWLDPTGSMKIFLGSVKTFTLS